MDDEGLIEIVAGGLSLCVCPGAGGTIVSLALRGGDGNVPVLEGIGAAELSLATADRAACFPMLPFANRAPGNILGAGGASYPVGPNTAEPFALHGLGWQRQWHVAERDGQSISLALDVGRDEYPFAFWARQSMALTPDTLTVSMSLTNTSRAAIPAGLGFHPYFPRRPGTLMRFAAERFWIEGPGYIPTLSIAVPPELDYRDARTAPSSWRNNCYSGWSGEAEVIQPELGYRVLMRASAALRDLMVFTPPGAPTFALEPQSHTTCATDSDALLPHARPLARLEPGETLEATMSLTVTQ